MNNSLVPPTSNNDEVAKRNFIDLMRNLKDLEINYEFDTKRELGGWASEQMANMFSTKPIKFTDKNKKEIKRFSELTSTLNWKETFWTAINNASYYGNLGLVVFSNAQGKTLFKNMHISDIYKDGNDETICIFTSSVFENQVNKTQYLETYEKKINGILWTTSKSVWDENVEGWGQTLQINQQLLDLKDFPVLVFKLKPNNKAIWEFCADVFPLINLIKSKIRNDILMSTTKLLLNLVNMPNNLKLQFLKDLKRAMANDVVIDMGRYIGAQGQEAWQFVSQPLQSTDLKLMYELMQNYCLKLMGIQNNDKTGSYQANNFEIQHNSTQANDSVEFLKSYIKVQLEEFFKGVYQFDIKYGDGAKRYNKLDMSEINIEIELTDNQIATKEMRQNENVNINKDTTKTNENKKDDKGEQQ